MANKRQFIYIIIIFIAIGVSSCIASVQNDDLYGSYVADYDFAKEKLTLNNDGTFIQEVTLKGSSRADVSKGTWTYDSQERYITFHGNFMVVIDGFKKFNSDYLNPRGGLVVLPVGKFLGRIAIEYEDGISYKKLP